MKPTTWLLAGAALLAGTLGAASAARADVIHLKDGRVLEGEAEWTDEGLRITLRMGELLVPRADVLRVEEKATPAEEYAERRADLDADDPDAVLALGRFALDHELEDEARALLLRAAELAPDRLDVHEALRDLDFHRVDGEWVPPEVYYPERGYVKVRGRWVTAEEAERIAAARDRRRARRDSREAEQEIRSADRALERAEDRLDDADEGVEVGRARVRHYEGEVERIGGLVEAARDAVRAAERRVAELEREYVAARRVYDAWCANPCACPHGRCACGWDRQRVIYLDAYTLADARLADARADRQRARRALAGHEGDLEEAHRLLARARKRLARAEADLRGAEREHAEARDRIDAAEGELDEAEDRLDDAQAPPPVRRAAGGDGDDAPEQAAAFPERGLVVAALEAYRGQAPYTAAERAAEREALDAAILAGEVSERELLARFARLAKGLSPEAADALAERTRFWVEAELGAEALTRFDRVLGALHAVDALAAVAAAQERHRAEHGAWAGAARDLFVEPAGRFHLGRSPDVPLYAVDVAADGGGWIAVATPSAVGYPYLARDGRGRTVASSGPIPLDPAAGVPARLEALPDLE